MLGRELSQLAQRDHDNVVTSLSVFLPSEYAPMHSTNEQFSSPPSTALSFDAGVEQLPFAMVQIASDGRLLLNAAASAIVGRAQFANVQEWFEQLCGKEAQAQHALYLVDRANGFPYPRIYPITSATNTAIKPCVIEWNGSLKNGVEWWNFRLASETSNLSERFRVIFEYSSDAHLIFDQSGIIDCNNAAISMLRCRDKRQVLSLHPAQLSPELQPDGRRSDEKCIEMDRLAQERGFHRFEWLHRRLDGSDFLVEVSLTPVRLSDRPALLVVWHDLTERIAAEEAQRQSEKRWLLALESSGDGVWDWDIASNRVFFSPRWKAMLGFAEHEIQDVRDEWDRRLHREDKERVYKEINQHLSGEKAQFHSEHRILCKDGSWKWILNRGMVVERSPDGKPKRMIGTHSDLTERMRIEISLRLEQERFRAINEASPVGIFTTDMAGRATYVNPRWCAITGFSEKDAQGDGWSRALHKDDRERVFAEWSNAVSQHLLFELEYRFTRPDGSVVWCHGLAAPMIVSGDPVGYVGMVSDISDRHATEEKLRDTLRRFDLVAAGAAIGIWETTLDPINWRKQINPHLPVYWSKRLLEMLGYRSDQFPDVLGSWFDALHPDDRDRVLAAMRDCLAVSMPYNTEYRLRHFDGSFHWYHATGEVERDVHGRPFRMAGSITDISARKRDEELLNTARAQLMDAISSLDAGFAMFDRDDRLIICNELFADWYGLHGIGMLPGTPHHEILTTMVQHGVLNDLGVDSDTWISQRLAAHVLPVEDIELRLDKRCIRISERRTAEGNIVSLHTDITLLKDAADEMRKARDLAENAVRTKANFLATMSHELRTPMNGVIGMTSLLLDTPLNTEQREYIETVRTCGDQLLTLINDILDFSKIESGNLVMERIPFSPRRMSEEVLSLFSEAADKKHVQLIAMISADVPWRLMGDPTRLRQILLNLIGNAVKFTESGEVVLSLSTRGTGGDHVLLDIAVRDSGIGISATARERLFKPFSQADDSTTRKYGGTGLGLVICQRLAQLMGGSIELESELGRGSTFTCRVPLSLADDQAPEFSQIALVNRHMLLISPAETSRRALRELCISWGMTCSEAVDLTQAQKTIQQQVPAVVLMDNDVAGGALDMVRALRNINQMSQVPLVLLMANAQRGMAAAAKEAGVSGFLTKPLRQGQLFDCLLVVLEQACRISDRPAAAANLVTRHTLEESKSQRRVLVAEDNPVNRQVAVAMLTKLGCQCDIACNGQEAVEAVMKQTYNVVFMDCQMPVMDGFAASTEIRRLEAGKNRVRIVALTANALQGDRDRCLAAGMDDYLTKPMKPTDLEAALARSDGAITTAVVSESEQLSEAILDEEAINMLLTATDEDTVRAVADMFKNDARAVIEEIQSAIKKCDLITISRAAHRLKGAAGTLGLRRVQTVAQRVENAARKSELQSAIGFCQTLKNVVDEALPVLARHPLTQAR
jgi:two-component system, sensor histidine kinase and response regulator